MRLKRSASFAGFRFPVKRVIRGVGFWLAALILALSCGRSIAFDQVSPRSGALSVDQADIFLATAVGPTPVSRSYSGAMSDGPLGPGWSMDVAQRFEVRDGVVAVGPSGREVFFFPAGNGYRSADGANAENKAGEWSVLWPNRSTSRFDRAGREIERRDRNGNATTYAYDERGRLARIGAVEGRSLRLRYGDRGRLVEIADAGARCSYEYDASGRLATVTDSDGWRTAYRYLDNGRLSEIAYPDGRTVQFAYDDAGRVVGRKSSAEPELTYRYTDRTTRVTVAGGAFRETSYDARGFPQSHRDSTGAGRDWTWDAQGRLSKESFPDGTSIAYTYDELGRLISQRTQGGDFLQLAYDGEGELPTMLEMNGAVTRYEYDAKSRLVSTTTPAGRRSRFGYDEHGRLAAITDGAGRTTRFEYDRTGNPARRVAPDGAETIWRYDAKGRMLSERGPDGALTSYSYLASGLPATVAGPDGATLHLRYDAHGRPVEVGVASEAIQLAYDGAGRPTRIQYPDGTSETTRYDAMGNVTESVNRLGLSTRFEYDDGGHLTSALLPGDSRLALKRDTAARSIALATGTQTLTLQRDPDGRGLRLRDASGAEARIQTDAFGRVTRLAYPGGGQEYRRYDADGLLQSITLPDGDRWEFAHDGAGQLLEIVLPGGRKTSVQYDAAGQVSQVAPSFAQPVRYRHGRDGLLRERINGRGLRVEYGYDAAGRLTSKKTPSATWRYRYDQRGNLLEASDGQFTLRHAYDRLGRQVRTEYPQWGKSIGYEYDTHGRLAARTDPQGKVTRYAYDALGRLARIEASEGNFRFGYDGEGRLIRRDNANGTVTEYAYDNGGRLARVAHLAADAHPMAVREYAYDADGNLTLATDQAGLKTSYRYDRERRLIEEAYPNGRIAYAYGAASDRLSVTGTGGAAAYRYNAAGQLVAAGETEYAYDADGNLSSRKDRNGTTRYAYDAEGRLTAVTLPNGTSVSYGYGPFGERIGRDENGRRTHYLLDGDDLLQELDERFQTRASYLYADLDTPLALTAEGHRQFLHQDATRTVIALSDEAGRLVARPSFDAFGNRRSESDARSPLGFGARPLDAATGLYDMRARFYDPASGRFISPDPLPGSITDPVSLAPYLYARANPLGFADPFGLESESAWSSVTSAMSRLAAALTGQSQSEAALRSVAAETAETLAWARRARPLTISPSAMRAPEVTGPPPAPTPPSKLVQSFQRLAAAQQGSMQAEAEVTALRAEADATLAWAQSDRRSLALPPSRSNAVTQIIPPPARPGFWQATAATVRTPSGIAAVGQIGMIGGDMYGEWSSGDDAGTVLRSRLEGLNGRTVLAGAGMGLGILALSAASPVVATLTGVAALGATAWGAGTRIGQAGSEFGGAIAAEYRAWTNDANAAATNERLSQMRAAPAAGRVAGSTAAPALQPQAPAPVTAPSPTPAPASAPATGAAPCPPGQMMGPKGVCETEKDILAQFRTWSQETKQAAPPKTPPPPPGKEEEKAPPVVEPQPPKQDDGDGMSGGFSGVESGGGTSPGTSVDDAARAFIERERRRSTDVGGRGLISGIGGTSGSKFGSDSIKRETQKVLRRRRRGWDR